MGDLGAYFGGVIIKFLVAGLVIGGVVALGGYFLISWLIEHVRVVIL
jgi:hypothetical protein